MKNAKAHVVNDYWRSWVTGESEKEHDMPFARTTAATTEGRY